MSRDRWTDFSRHFLRLLVVAAIAVLGAFPVAASARGALHDGPAVMAVEAMAHAHGGLAHPSEDGAANHGLTCELACLSVPTPDLRLFLAPPVTLFLDLAHPAENDARPGRDPDPAARPPKHLPV